MLANFKVVDKVVFFFSATFSCCVDQKRYRLKSVGFDGRVCARAGSLAAGGGNTAGFGKVCAHGVQYATGRTIAHTAAARRLAATAARFRIRIAWPNTRIASPDPCTDRVRAAPPINSTFCLLALVLFLLLWWS